ncbi:Uncharacterized protein dnm_060300 [Desulfonema magnum]|uniref:Uncharacterized protein n=1 Tax=Desulfonema magnum TaxID=45655 RepID=A0A975BQT1_9BACT|nr:Uncharacterized protein dnm_060300 [Desulfonema magnum]
MRKSRFEKPGFSGRCRFACGEKSRVSSPEEMPNGKEILV